MVVAGLELVGGAVVVTVTEVAGAVVVAVAVTVVGAEVVVAVAVLVVVAVVPVLQPVKIMDTNNRITRGNTSLFTLNLLLF